SVLARRTVLSFGSSPPPSARPHCVGPGPAALPGPPFHLPPMRAGAVPETAILPRVLNAMAKPDPCGLQQVKSVCPSSPPRLALAVAPPLTVLNPPYVFITPLPTYLTPQSRPIDHRSSPTAFPPDTPPPGPAFRPPGARSSRYIATYRLPDSNIIAFHRDHVYRAYSAAAALHGPNEDLDGILLIGCLPVSVRRHYPDIVKITQIIVRQSKAATPPIVACYANRLVLTPPVASLRAATQLRECQQAAARVIPHRSSRRIQSPRTN
ncbi:hypothetical protein C8F04DRAFT_1345555, partial [Mycena alexandri]